MPGKLAQAASAAFAQATAKFAPTIERGVAIERETAEELPPAEVPKSRADALRKKYRSAERRVDTAKEALATAKADIVAEMGAAEVLRITETGRPFAELKTITSLTFDTTRFRSENPEQAAGYMKPQSSRRFRLIA